MKILNFGSLNIDYVYQVDHFVRPGETIRAGSREVCCGGKGLNQSVALARAGAEVCHAGRVGRDGEDLLRLLEAEGVDTRFIETGGVTGHAVIQIDRSGENCIIVYGGANREISRPFIERVLSGFGRGDLLLLQNEINEIPFIMEKAHEKGLEIAFNPSPADEALKGCPLELVDLFILNSDEGRALTGERSPERVCASLVRRGGAVLLTLGKEGAFFKDKEREYFQPAFAVETVDTTGAGDTFAGYFLASAAAGLGLPEAMRRAAMAAALAVTKKGAAASIPALAQVLAALRDCHS